MSRAFATYRKSLLCTGHVLFSKQLKSNSTRPPNITDQKTWKHLMRHATTASGTSWSNPRNDWWINYFHDLMTYLITICSVRPLLWYATFKMFVGTEKSYCLRSKWSRRSIIGQFLFNFVVQCVNKLHKNSISLSITIKLKQTEQIVVTRHSTSFALLWLYWLYFTLC